MDYASFCYMILYVVVIVTAVIGNVLFLLVIKKNESLHTTIHFFIMSLAVRDVIISLLVIPILIDSLINWRGGWQLPLFVCKLYEFLSYGLRGVHTFTLLFAAIFLFSFHRRIVNGSPGLRDVGRTKSHKWAVPLAWVLGLGLAIPAGALAIHNKDLAWCQGPTSDPLLVAATVSSVIPLVVIVFALVGLGLQVFHCYDIQLKPPHDPSIRSSWTVMVMIVLLILTQGPFQAIQIITFVKHLWTTELRHLITAILYIPCLIHPFIYFSLNPQYRNGLKVIFCSKKSPKDQEEKYRSPPSIIKLGRGYGYGRSGGGNGGRPDVLQEESQPMLNLLPADKCQNPGLPGKFSFGEFEYTDTAKVEPRIAYSPAETPKSKPLLHYTNKPFKQPNYIDGTWVMPGRQQDQGSNPESCYLTTSPEDEHINSKTSKSETFEIESLESSPGTSLRVARKKMLHINQLEASPGGNRRRNATTNGINGINDGGTTTGISDQGEGTTTNGISGRGTTTTNGISGGGTTTNGISGGGTTITGISGGGTTTITNENTKGGTTSTINEINGRRTITGIRELTLTRKGTCKEGIKKANGMSTEDTITIHEGIATTKSINTGEITTTINGVQETRLEDALPGQVKDKIKALENFSRKNAHASEKLT